MSDEHRMHIYLLHTSIYSLVYIPAQTTRHTSHIFRLYTHQKTKSLNLKSFRRFLCTDENQIEEDASKLRLISFTPTSLKLDAQHMAASRKCNVDVWMSVCVSLCVCVRMYWTNFHFLQRDRERSVASIRSTLNISKMFVLSLVYIQTRTTRLTLNSEEQNQSKVRRKRNHLRWICSASVQWK